MLHKALPLCISALVAASFAMPANAQEGFEEIVVTATKREQTLQEVPVAVSVTDSDTIQKAQILDILDLQSVVPSLRVTQLQSSGNTNFVIRGFGNGANNPGIEPSVAVFIDGVYRSRSAAALSDLPNLERVEVLRGPQSTLFGKNASAGVISVVTAMPDEEFGGSVEAIGGNFGLGALKGYISGPLSENLGFSLGASVNQRDGFITDITNLPTRATEYNERDRWSVRGQLAWYPSDTVSLRLIADLDEIDELCCGLANILSGPTAGAVRAVGGDLVEEAPFSRTSFYNFDPRNQVENSGVSVQADIDLSDNMTLTSITAFRNVSRVEDFDADFTSADILGRNFSDTDIDTFTQELRLAFSVGESVDWMIGAFYFDEEVGFDTDLRYGADARNYADLLTGAPGTFAALEAALAPFGVPAGSFFANGTGVAEFSGQDNTATSLFAQVDWYASDRSTITLGINYTRDEKDAFVRQQNSDVFASLDFVAIGFAQIFAALEAANPGDPANLPTAQFLSTVPCTAATGPACNPLLGLQALQVLPQFADFPNSVENGNSDDGEVTWTVRYAFDLSDDINLYASASTGFKATSWNLSRDSRPFAADLAAVQAAQPTGPIPNLTSGTRFAAPEESTVYELGLKARFERGMINIAVFDQTIEGFQSNIFTGVGFSLANAGEQSTVGLEFDGTYYPIDALKLTLAATFLDPLYDSFAGAQGPTGPVDLSGTEPAGIHPWSAVASVTYTKDFSGGLSGFIRGEFLHESDTQVVENIAASTASRDVNVLNASFGLSTDSGWDATIWGRNLTDDEFLLSAAPSVFQAGSFSGYPNPPRTYGITLRKSF